MPDVRPAPVTATAPGGVRPAGRSAADLPDLPSPVPAWPGEQVPADGGTVFLRHTPRTGADEGARALYVHGLGGASTNWTDLAALLSGRLEGFAVDLPGFGRSAPPPHGRYSIARHVQAVEAVLADVAARPGPGRDQPVHLLGNSLGGLVSLLVAVRRPDLVATLTLISPAMPVYRVPPAFDRAIALLLVPGVPALAEKRVRLGAPEDRVRMTLEMCFGDPARVPPERLAEAVEEMRLRDGQSWSGRALTRSMRGLMTSYLRVGRANAWRAARSVTAPALVVWGDRDKLVDPRLAPRLATALPDARLQVQAGIGHVAMMEAPEDTARAVLAMLEETGSGLLDGTGATGATGRSDTSSAGPDHDGGPAPA
ncbi:Lysophospholipase, alpha-beta hydrolase superfamily [Klenkia marina]|uniref:Lysophospholipase, alpha-beta hydrolase superfamily n=1 Tax=Klenkia marina TaxID=1960309 RepID=A0A1G4YGY6_9ACTN|nr:alpha/beta hydrolase [Klenkia marina]SCX52068.1 Lysophospholipase, alpha-beta hydrolase superfamily [Klenkia marina]